MRTGRPPMYHVRLTHEEVLRCDTIIASSACKTIISRCRVLVGLNNCMPGKLSYNQVALATNMTRDFVTSVAKRYCLSGMTGIETIDRNPKSNTGRLKLDALYEAPLIAMACKAPPEGAPRWTLKLLTKCFNEDMKQDGRTSNFSQATIWRALERNKLHPHRSEYWCIRETTPEFLMRMEKVLHIYSLPYDPRFPVVCMDEAAIQLVHDVRERLAPICGSSAKIDYEYGRAGVKDLFVFIEPLTGQYYVRVSDSRTAVDWAYHVRNLVNGPYRDAEKVILITDNLNTHEIESLYKAFGPEEARQIVERIEIVYTPSHASWLNVAEIGINTLKTGCIGSRFRSEAQAKNLPAIVDQWVEQRNAEKRPINWTFTVDSARKRPRLTWEPKQESSSVKYANDNAQCPAVAVSTAIRTSLIPSDIDEKGDVIDLCRSVDEDGNEYWAVSLENEIVALREPVGKKQIARTLHQQCTSDGWKIPRPKIHKSKKESSTPQIVYDYNFQAHGEDVVALYNKPYDEQYPVICVCKRGYDLENPANNSWIGNLRAEPKPKKPRKKEEEKTEGETQQSTPEVAEQDIKEPPVLPQEAGTSANQGGVESEEQPDTRIGITLLYAPHTGQKIFHISDMKDDTSWAESMYDLVEKRYPNAKQIQLVMSPDDASKISSVKTFYQADEALKIWLKISTHTVPHNALWLNFAEVEAVTVARQCLKDGVSSSAEVAAHLAEWAKQPTFVDVNMTTDSFRRVFSKVYRPATTSSPNSAEVTVTPSTQMVHAPPQPTLSTGSQEIQRQVAAHSTTTPKGQTAPWPTDARLTVVKQRTACSPPPTKPCSVPREEILKEKGPPSTTLPTGSETNIITNGNITAWMKFIDETQVGVDNLFKKIFY